ncbi:MAG: DNA alkylation repair protein [Candidatus Eremiobacteraeota bacterium]|nr:DNA alkylation repair protein [Candidatus Eremiobacteraeota bacterium]
MMSHKVPVDKEQIINEFSNVGDVAGFLDKTQKFLDFYSEKSYESYVRTRIPEVEKVYGVPILVLHIIAKMVGEFGDRLPGISEYLIRKLWQKKTREERIIACEALVHCFAVDRDMAMTLILEFIPDLDNREICDMMACVGLKPYSLQYPKVILRMIVTWIKSPNPWVRRFGVMSLIPMARRKELLPLDPYFIILKRVMKDKDNMVGRAISRVLREITPKDEFRVAGFLEVFARDPDPSTIVIIKEGSKKLNSDLRNSLMKIL